MRNNKIFFGLFLTTLFFLKLFTGFGEESLKLFKINADNVMKHLLCKRKRDLSVTGDWLFLV